MLFYIDTSIEDQKPCRINGNKQKKKQEPAIADKGGRSDGEKWQGECMKKVDS
jgi:hypothetical protein